MTERITADEVRQIANHLPNSWCREAEKLDRLADQMEVDYKRMAILEKLVAAVLTGKYEVYCPDVDGKNWFDVRDEVTK